jgi:hypothetical protein
MPANRPEDPIVNIYAPRFAHEPIDVIGNQRGLERLINVLIDAIGEKRAKGLVATSDGHHSEVRATCLQGRRRPEEWRRAGSPRWDVSDPLIARIMELTEENERLRKVISALRHLRKSVQKVDHLGGNEAPSGGAELLD